MFAAILPMVVDVVRALDGRGSSLVKDGFIWEERGLLGCEDGLAVWVWPDPSDGSSRKLHGSDDPGGLWSTYK